MSDEMNVSSNSKLLNATAKGTMIFVFASNIKQIHVFVINTASSVECLGSILILEA